MPVTLEICVDTAAGIAAAAEGGADRIELCSALELGGLTPSTALLDRAVASGLPTHAMIRPRAGGFVYDADEIELMAADIRHALSLGAAGVVVGALKADRTLNVQALARFREAARDGTFVLHRAIDLTTDPMAAIEEACSIGVDKVLSSGGEATAVAGAQLLGQMTKAAGGRLSLIAGSGIAPENVARVVRLSGVREVHGSASEPGPTDSRDIAMGFALGPPRRTSVAIIRRLRAAIQESI
jgi:copper homeostasis protein